MNFLDIVFLDAVIIPSRGPIRNFIFPPLTTVARAWAADDVVVVVFKVDAITCACGEQKGRKGMDSYDYEKELIE